jgi:Domain of unknown function (DUF5680)
MKHIENLHDFIISAKAACYVGDGCKTKSSRQGSHDLGYAQADFKYLDCYYGGTDFIGQECVWFCGAPVWTMNYYGRILRADLIDGERAGQVIKAALSSLYREERFLGGFDSGYAPYRYIDTNAGTFESFTGIETIMREAVVCYRLDYHGGLVRE